MKSLLLGTIVIVSGGLLSAQTPAQTSPASPPETRSQGKGQTNGDQPFVTAAASDGMAEVELGKLAGEKATNASVKAFAQRMVTDHSKAGDELKSLASSKQITLPAAIDAKHKAAHDRLAKLAGSEFDRAYVREMVAGHKKAVSAFTTESMSGKDSDIKAWAGKTLPTLREHLTLIEALDKEVSVARSTK
jgi:putative membrane protein